MIRKFNIENFGSYKNYTWCKSLNHQSGYFNKVNLIFGRNYSGKTTLSRLLRVIENNELHNDYKDAKFSIDTYEQVNYFNESNVSTINSKEKIFVYNTDFIKDNLQWLVTDQGNISSFAILGKENIELKEKIHQIEESIKSDEPLLIETQKSFEQQEQIEKQLEKEINDLMTNNARDIRNNPQWFGNPNYNRNNLEKEIIKKNLVKLSIEEYEEYLTMLKEDNKEKIKKSNLLCTDLIDLVDIKSVNLLLKKEIKISNVINELIENSTLEDWIKVGYNLHKNKEEYCKFCNNEIKDGIFEKIESHFSKESQSLISEIETKITELEIIKSKNMKVLEKEIFYMEYHKQLLKLNLDANNIVVEQKNWIDFIIDQLNHRKKNIFVSLSGIKKYTGKQNKINKSELFLLIDKNNKKSESIVEDHKKIKEKLRRNKILEIKMNINYDSKIKMISIEKDKKNELCTKLNLLLTKKSEEILLKEKYTNELSAEENTKNLINQYLAVFFSKSQIAIKIHNEDSEKLFMIVRNGEVAINLSEGERRIISFCYYLAKINDALKEEKSNKELTLYIDDPISSLDNNHIFTIFSLINDLIVKKGHYKQLFISTHSLEFLRYLKRLSIEDKFTNYYYIEREVREKDNDSKSNFTIMPNHLKKYTTEFHHLFKEIYQFYKQDVKPYSDKVHHSHTTHYNLPNNIRKFLEIYLFYKFPSDESLTIKVERFFGESLPTLLNRIINEYSHLTSLERGYIPFDISELKKCVEILISTMKSKDSDQLEDLIKSIK